MSELPRNPEAFQVHPADTQSQAGLTPPDHTTAAAAGRGDPLSDDLFDLDELEQQKQEVGADTGAQNDGLGPAADDIDITVQPERDAQDAARREASSPPEVRQPADHEEKHDDDTEPGDDRPQRPERAVATVPIAEVAMRGAEADPDAANTAPDPPPQPADDGPEPTESSSNVANPVEGEVGSGPATPEVAGPSGGSQDDPEGDEPSGEEPLEASDEAPPDQVENKGESGDDGGASGGDAAAKGEDDDDWWERIDATRESRTHELGPVVTLHELQDQVQHTRPTIMVHAPPDVLQTSSYEVVFNRAGIEQSLQRAALPDGWMRIVFANEERQGVEEESRPWRPEGARPGQVPLTSMDSAGQPGIAFLDYPSMAMPPEWEGASPRQGLVVTINNEKFLAAVDRRAALLTARRFDIDRVYRAETEITDQVVRDALYYASARPETQEPAGPYQGVNIVRVLAYRTMPLNQSRGSKQLIRYVPLAEQQGDSR
jgi:hypothetical protein